MESSRDVEKNHGAPNIGSSTADIFVSVNLQNVINLDYLDTNLTPLKIAENIGAGSRSFTITNLSSNILHGIFVGCNGDDQVGQKQVAGLIRLLLEGNRPAFIVLGGDNFYPHGIDSANDPRVVELLKLLCKKFNIPIHVINGNHDYGYDDEEYANSTILKIVGLTKNVVQTPSGKQRGMHQVAFTYTPENKYPQQTSAVNSAKIYSQQSHDLKQLPPWNMPALYYTKIAGNTQFFFLDSSHLADEFLTWLESGEKKPLTTQNQISWLLNEYNNCLTAGKEPISFQHHPLKDISSRGRYGLGDAKKYFSTIERWEKLAMFFKLDPEDGQYDELLTHIYNYLKINFLAIFSAHVHAFYNYINGNIRQFVAGGGGGKLQTRESFDKHEKVGFYLKEFGIMKIAIDINNAKEMRIDVITVDPIDEKDLFKMSEEVLAEDFDVTTIFRHHLTLGLATHTPITIQSEETEPLYSLVARACLDYGNLLSNKRNETDRQDKDTYLNSYTYTKPVKKKLNKYTAKALPDVDGMHNIMAFFLQSTLPDLQTCLVTLKKLMTKLELKDANSLYYMINAALKASPYFGKTIEELLDVNSYESLSPSLKY